MGATSFIFFGLLLLPLLGFLYWLIKQDKRKNLLGIVLLCLAICGAIYVITKLDKNFVETNSQITPKSSNF
ncbi:hypothetical protein [Pedobacter sp.]|uniref:hypothetical protein n=1 Tax=Pedobacter sp. TaxID=1411316 RepID=UPI00396CCCD6